VPWLGVGELVSLGMGGEFIAPARGPSGAALAGIIRYGVTSRTVTAPPLLLPFLLPATDMWGRTGCWAVLPLRALNVYYCYRLRGKRE
jgi:uncharacterized RDD family membrane protein YckC